GGRWRGGRGTLPVRDPRSAVREQRETLFWNGQLVRRYCRFAGNERMPFRDGVRQIDSLRLIAQVERQQHVVASDEKRSAFVVGVRLQCREIEIAKRGRFAAQSQESEIVFAHGRI